MRSDVLIASLCLLTLGAGCVDTTLPDAVGRDQHPAQVAQMAAPPAASPCTQPGQRCTDHDRCTQLDLCDEALRCTGVPIACDDGIACTHEVCHPATGQCHYDTWSCGCQAADDCDDGDPCTLDFCDYERIGCSHEVMVDEMCDPGDPCHEDARCQPDGTCGGGWNACVD